MKNLKNAFDNDVDFFKSTELKENGSLLQKAIPTVEKKTITKKVTVSEPKKPTAAITAFKKKVEDSFKIIDNVVKDLVADLENMSNYQTEECVEMLASYKKFKSKFSYIVNDAINYPKTKEAIKDEMKEESNYDKTRIRI